MQILSVGRALPEHYYDQKALIDAFTAYWSRQHFNPSRVARFHEAVQVGGRHLALPMEEYEKLGGFGDANDAYIRVATDVGEAAIRDALDRAGLAPQDVDAIYFTTVTGVATPSIDARLFNRLGLRSDVRRVPMFGLGCVAGAAGVARLNDYLRAWPDHVAVLLSVELCSLTLQRKDLTVANLIASGLFGDGAAAVVAVGSERAARMQTSTSGPRVLASRSRFYPESEDVMGWNIGDDGFQIVLKATVPNMVRQYMADDLSQFLHDHQVDRSDITSWVCHPGGPKVLTAFQDTLDLPPDALELTWRSLHEVGNLSSSSVLFVLHDTMEQRRPPSGDKGMMLAMGPGFCSELVLLEW